MKHVFFSKFIFGSLWVMVISTGLVSLWRYTATEGEAAVAPRQWPLVKKDFLAQDHATLLITLHPHCPCSRATVGELEKLMAQAQGQLKTRALFIRPPGVPVDWEKTDLWQQASRIPGVSIISDEAGNEAQLFGAKTSGQAMLYDKQGLLLFSGGITAGRGHAGDNAGRATILALLKGEPVEKLQTPVYGCPLLSAQDECIDQPVCPLIHTHANSK